MAGVVRETKFSDGKCWLRWRNGCWATYRWYMRRTEIQFSDGKCWLRRFRRLLRSRFRRTDWAEIGLFADADTSNVSCSFYTHSSSVIGVTLLSELFKLPVSERYFCMSGISTVFSVPSILYYILSLVRMQFIIPILYSMLVEISQSVMKHPKVSVIYKSGDKSAL